MVAATACAPLSKRRTDRLFVELASGADDIREAQALRYRVFAEEMGARLTSEHSGLDVDEFDTHCQHLLVRDARSGRVVGCTRLLTDVQASRLGRFYAESEFDLSAILRLEGRLLEIGRTCIAPEFRQGSAIAVLWSGLAGFVHLQGIDYLFGCASMPLGEQDLQAAAIMNRLRRQAMICEQLRVTPRAPLHLGKHSNAVLDAPLPPLLRAYVRLGARVCGEPCRDPDFGVADALMLLKVDELNPAYSRHFFERTAPL